MIQEQFEYWLRRSFKLIPARNISLKTLDIRTDQAMKSLELSFKLEDVFFTGILRHKAHLKPAADMTAVRLIIPKYDFKDQFQNKICDHLGSKNAIAQRLERYVAHTKNGKK